MKILNNQYLINYGVPSYMSKYRLIANIIYLIQIDILIDDSFMIDDDKNDLLLKVIFFNNLY